MDAEEHHQQVQASGAGSGLGHLALILTCFLALATYGLMIDRKGINTDEGLRLAIINGGEAYMLGERAVPATWSRVLQLNSHSAYQPLYFLIQNTLMRVAGTHDVVFFRLVNVLFLWVCLQGLLTLSQTWRLVPRLFLLGLFSFNAYLFMHVLQIREYIAGIAFYIWSTWLVLHLDARRLERPWRDGAWFAGYGVLLTLGFYLQTWVIFPIIGQFLFLFFRPAAGRWRFYAHLTVSYVIVLAATVPYLLTHTQKVNVGRWGTETSRLWPQLSDGFHLVVTGHLAGHSRFTEFLFWFWPAVIIGAALLIFRRQSAAVPPAGFKRQGLLMVLCLTVSLAFQVGYFFKVENLSVWPRYFIIHYFFFTWLVALSFNYLYSLRRASATSAPMRSGLTAVLGVILGVMMISGLYQTRSYYRDPYLDTGLTPVFNWKTLAREVALTLQPADAVITYDFIARATLTFTRPLAHPVLVLPDLEKSDLQSIDRLVYIESSYVQAERETLAARMNALGFIHMQEAEMHSADGKNLLNHWRILVFQR